MRCVVAFDWATVGLCELASANVVGYQEVSLRSGLKAVGASFATIGAEGCKLTQIKPAGFNTSAGAVSIQILDNYGQTTTTYSYYKGGRGAYATEGWYNGTTRITADNDITFAPGTGLWMKGADGYTFTTSGEVLFDDVTCQLRSGLIMLANPYPMDVKLTNLKPAGFNTSAGAVSIQILDNYGQTTTTYSYYKGGRGAYATEGWYNGTTRITADNDVTFVSGDGLWVKGADGYTLTFSLNSETAE